ncbi:MAG: 50S ribosomal protein L24 [Synergistaceae bacterium]|jgi:large subunit ribosomal protein L24|nr:50S ribosomal protein L24 [Synergistaceae bacterium]
MSMRIKKNDRVRVIAGKDKGKEGKILRRIPEKDLVVVEGVNMVSRHTKPSQKNPQAGIIKQEAPIYASKVMLVCPQCGKATRVGCSFLESGKKVRVCRKCSEIIDRT